MINLFWLNKFIIKVLDDISEEFYLLAAKEGTRTRIYLVRETNAEESQETEETNEKDSVQEISEEASQ